MTSLQIQKKFQQNKKAKGQMAVETILLLVLFVSVFSLVSKHFKGNQFIENIVSSPWKKLSGLLQNGDWKEPKDSIANHPSQKNRHSSIVGDP